MLKTKVALAGNGTAVSRMAGENSTTEPRMLVRWSISPAQSHIKYCIHVKNKSCIGGGGGGGGGNQPQSPVLRREFYH